MAVNVWIMSDASVTIVRDPAELAERAADVFVDLVSAAIAARGRCAVALAGGSTPRAMNARLAAEPRRGHIDWPKVAFFFGDERCVPPDNAESNYRMTHETLFAPLGISEQQIFRIAGEAEPRMAADAYDALLEENLGKPPVFDLIDLGMGPDGHTASLFPGTLATIDRRRSVVANFVAKFNSYRITITPQVIAAARNVLITAAGAEKAQSLQAVLEGQRDTTVFPAQLVLSSHANARWIVDAAAASKLTSRCGP